MCLITEPVQVGKRYFSASLPSSVLLTTSCPKPSVSPQQIRSPGFLIRTLLKPQPGQTLCNLPFLGLEQWFSACRLQASGSLWTSLKESLKGDWNSFETRHLAGSTLPQRSNECQQDEVRSFWPPYPIVPE